MTGQNEKPSPGAVDTPPASQPSGKGSRSSGRAAPRRGSSGRQSGRAVSDAHPPAAHAPAGPTDWRIRLFDADRTDREVGFEDALEMRVGERQLLWIDARAPMEHEAAASLAKRLELKPATQVTLEGQPAAASMALHGSYFSIAVAAIATEDGREEARWLTVVAGRNVVVTAHAQPIGFLEDTNRRIEADTLVGAIDSASFVAAILDSAVTGYFAAVDAIEDAIDRLDALSLRRDTGDDLLRDLVALRGRIARLRRIISGQRELFASLGRTDFAAIAEGDVAEPFRGVSERFERAVDAVENSRELLLGSFDVYMTRTAQRTNEIMKTLTIVSVLLLPGGVIAGFMGMNNKPPYSNDDPVVFWIVLALILTLAVATLVFLRIRRWL